MLGWSCASRAAAQVKLRPALHWSRAPQAESCVDPKTLAERVETLTGPVLVAPTDAELSIEGHVEARSSGGFRVRITVTNKRGAPTGERLLDFATRDCRTIDSSVALVIATLIDPALGVEGLPPNVLALGVDETPPEQQVAAELVLQPARPLQSVALVPARAASPQARPRAHEAAHARRAFELGLGALAGPGPLRAFALGALASAEWSALPWLRLALQADARTALQAVPLDGLHSLQAQEYGLAFLACPRRKLGAGWWITSGIGPELEHLAARGIGFSTDQTAHSTALRARAVLGVQARLGERWTLGAEALAQLSLGNKTFSYQRMTQVYVVGPERSFGITALLALRYAL
ncbi:MAG TPA: hypothetical protein VF331_20690 [Polyangiales bacterium]